MLIEIMPSNPVFAPLKWALTARAKENGKYVLNGVLIEADRCVATDGQRLHLHDLPPHDIDPGMYTVAQNTSRVPSLVQTDGKFPEYRRILPGDAECARIGQASNIYFALRLLCKRDIAVNIAYLESVFGQSARNPGSCTGNSTIFDIYIANDAPICRPVMFRHAKATALIMPFDLPLEGCSAL